MDNKFIYQPKGKKINKWLNLIKLPLIILIIGAIFGCQDNSDSELAPSPQIQNKPIPCSSEVCLKDKIQKAQTQLDSLTERRKQINTLYDEYDRQLDEYLDKLSNKLPSLGIESHENLLRQCDQYIETCNWLERAAILKYSMDWIKNKIDKTDLQIGKLDQIIWKLNKKIELSAIASPEEQAKVDELIVSTTAILEKQITPPEAQDTAKLQQEIFDQVINGYSTPTPNSSPTESSSHGTRLYYPLSPSP